MIYTTVCKPSYQIVIINNPMITVILFFVCTKKMMYIEGYSLFKQKPGYMLTTSRIFTTSYDQCWCISNPNLEIHAIQIKTAEIHPNIQKLHSISERRSSPLSWKPSPVKNIIHNSTLNQKAIPTFKICSKCFITCGWATHGLTYVPTHINYFLWTDWNVTHTTFLVYRFFDNNHAVPSKSITGELLAILPRCQLQCRPSAVVRLKTHRVLVMELSFSAYMWKDFIQWHKSVFKL